MVNYRKVAKFLAAVIIVGEILQLLEVIGINFGVYFQNYKTTIGLPLVVGATMAIVIIAEKNYLKKQKHAKTGKNKK